MLCAYIKNEITIATPENLFVRYLTVKRKKSHFAHPQRGEPFCSPLDELFLAIEDPATDPFTLSLKLKLAHITVQFIVITSVTFWGWFMALATIRLKKKKRWQQFLLGLPALLIGVAGPTRIYLGDHWASDVLGGYLFGGAWLGIFVQLYKKLRREKV